MRRDRKDGRLFSLREGMGKGHVYLCVSYWALMQRMYQGARVPDVGGRREAVVGPVLRALANPIHHYRRALVAARLALTTTGQHNHSALHKLAAILDAGGAGLGPFVD